jgi:CxxC motif-containing protein (DUF1111 family)
MTRLLVLLATVVVAIPAAAEDGLGRAVGRALFARSWIPAPSSTAATDGLGPYFDARSCAGCHPGAGAARLRVDPKTGELAGLGLILRLGDTTGRADPVYGHQLQRQAVPTLLPEAEWSLTVVAGAAPALVVERWSQGRLASSASVRAAPDLRGLGGLEHVLEEAVLVLADPDDADGDGISGRAHRIGQTGRLGRFGLKATAPDLETQIATAFLLDLGLATPGRPMPAGDCTPYEAACLAAPQGATDGMAELPAAVVDAVAAHLRSFPAPPPPNGPGRRLFEAAGCAACHVVELATGSGETVPAGTDLLLHDLGPGLADNVAEGDAAGSEWRTAVLAGIGRRLAAGARLLHDGRAADVTDAVAWHGGEAKKARSRFELMSPGERDKLVAWLEAWL